MIFKRLTRKAKTAIRRTRRRPAEIYHDPRPHLDSVSDITPSLAPTESLLLTNELRPLPRIKLAAKRSSKINNLTNSEDISQLKLNDDDRLDHNFALEPWEWPERQNAMQTKISSVTQEDSPNAATVRLIIFRNEHEKQRALLLTSAAYTNLQALARLRQDLREVDAKMATSTAEVEVLIAAKGALGSQEEFKVPGAFYEDGADEERERQHLLMLTFVRKLRLCEKTLEDLEARREGLVEELEAAQERVLGDLERALRDEHSPAASGPDVAGDSKSVAWWAK